MLDRGDITDPESDSSPSDADQEVCLLTSLLREGGRSRFPVAMVMSDPWKLLRLFLPDPVFRVRLRRFRVGRGRGPWLYGYRVAFVGGRVSGEVVKGSSVRFKSSGLGNDRYRLARRSVSSSTGELDREEGEMLYMSKSVLSRL